jgi:hypothetical protein
MSKALDDALHELDITRRWGEKAWSEVDRLQRRLEELIGRIPSLIEPEMAVARAAQKVQKDGPGDGHCDALQTDPEGIGEPHHCALMAGHDGLHQVGTNDGRS